MAITGITGITGIAGAGNALAHGDLHVVIDRLTVELASDPGNAALLLRRAEMYRLHHAFEQADADYARALALEPANPDARWMRARSRLEGGRPEKALAELDAFVGEHPANPSARLTRARTLTALGRIADAALEYGEDNRGIHVNTLSLGGTLTPGYTASLERRATGAGMTFSERMKDETSNVPLRKYGKPEEVANAVEGLLSPFFDHMTGINILHDGGFTRAY